MKSSLNLIVAGFGLFVGATSTLYAEEGSTRGPLASTLISDSFAEETALDVRGWISSGATFQTQRDSRFNGPVTFNDEAERLQLDQAYLILEKKTTAGGDEFSLGGRVDVMYGADTPFTQSLGFDNELYGSSSPKHQWAIPQVYIEANLPVGTGLSVKLGHFYTLLGYEVVTAPDNFFYSHSYSMQYAEPFTHWGALSSYNFSDDLTTTVGMVRGNDNLSDPADSNLSFLGGLTYRPCEETTAVLSLTSGNQGHGQNMTIYSFVLTHLFNDDWSYVLQHDLGSHNANGGSLNWYSVNNYVFYELSAKNRLGFRFEWFNDADGSRVAGLRSGSALAAADYFSLSLGTQHKFTEHLMLRPEVRYDWQTGEEAGSRAFGEGQDRDQLLAALNLLATF